MSAEEAETVDTTRQYYETQAQQYFDVTHNVSLNPQWQAFSRRLVPGAAIIDLGCGSGRDLKYFSTNGFRVVGLDYSQSLLMLAREHSRQVVVAADLHAIPFSDASFDAAWAVGSLLHVSPGQIVAVLREVRRVLNTGGFLFSSVKEGQGEVLDSSGRRTYYYGRREWGGYIEASGLRLVEQKITEEARGNSLGGVVKIKWIETLAQAAVA